MSPAVLFCLTACAYSTSNPFEPEDASTDSIKEELVCAPNQCGLIIDKNLGIETDCGSCANDTVCGDNGVANVCGSECVPIRNPNGTNDTAGCNYALGAGWAEGFGQEVQFPYACAYVNQNICFNVVVDWPKNGICSGTTCGNWWCCIENKSTGLNVLLPGANGNSDGGL